MLRPCIFFLGILTFSLFVALSIASVRADDWSPLWTTANLSVARSNPAATSADGKAFFAGGYLNGSGSSVVDIYDATTGTWSTDNLSVGRYNMGATSAGNQVFFGGGTGVGGQKSVVDIYNTSTGAWSKANLSVARECIGAGSAEGKVLFGGGGNGSSGSRVDILDTSTGIWSTASLSQSRNLKNATSSGSKVFFGGGWGNGAASNVVDIYDASSGLWSTKTWSKAHDYPATASTNGMVFFAGGWDGSTNVSAVEVYNASTGLWSVANLSQGRSALAGAAVGNKVLFGGGAVGDVYSNVVDIYDTSTGVWSTANLSQARMLASATSVGNRVLFAGGFLANGGYSKVVDIYTLQTYSTITSSKAFTLVDQTTVAGRMQLDSGASLNLDSYNLTVGSMGGVAPINLSTHTLTAGTDNTDSIYSGQINGGGNLVKTGNGKLTLNAANGYTGPTTIGSGSLIVNGSLASASAVTVQNGGTLRGVGSVGSVAVNLGGHVAPGDVAGSVGKLTLNGGLSLVNGAKLDFDLSAPGVSDLISMPSSTLTLHNQQFSDFAFNPEDGFGPGVYTLIDAGDIQGTLVGNLSGTIGGRNASISTVGGDLVLTVVPEPSTLVLLGVAALGLLAFVRRRTM